MNLEKVFSQLVPESFKFLGDEYGFSKLQEQEWLFFALSERAVIRIFLDRHQVFVDLKPLSSSAKREPTIWELSGGVDIAVIVECIEPNTKTEFRTVQTASDIKEELNKYALLLQKYCASMLRGDFAAWPQIANCIDQREKYLQQKLKRFEG